MNGEPQRRSPPRMPAASNGSLDQWGCHNQGRSRMFPTATMTCMYSLDPECQPDPRCEGCRHYQHVYPGDEHIARKGMTQDEEELARRMDRIRELEKALSDTLAALGRAEGYVTDPDDKAYIGPVREHGALVLRATLEG